MSEYILPGFSLDLTHYTKSLNYSTYAPKIKRAKDELWKKFENKSVGFYNWPIDITETLIQDTEKIASEIKKNHDAVLLVGIGGSYLGAKALLDALETTEFPIHWISNVDRSSLKKTNQNLKGKKTAVVLISKSGSTVETLSILYSIEEICDAKSFTVITDSEIGELRRLSQKNGWPSLPVPKNIGGRFSVFTPVGLLPLALAGFNIKDLLDGALDMRKKIESLAIEQNPVFQYALGNYAWTVELHKPIHILMPYETNLVSLGDWFIQLWAESLGKKRVEDQKPTGFTPIRCLGTTDQHSQLQLFKEGPQDKVLGFIDVKAQKPSTIPVSKYVSKEFEFITKHSVEKINTEASKAVEKSLQLSHMPTYRITFDALNLRSLGSFLFFQMTSCGIAGELFGVNAFDQPGVEEAKKLLRSAL